MHLRNAKPLFMVSNGEKVVEFVVAKLNFIENDIESGLGFETTLTFELEWCRMSFVKVFEARN